MGAVKFFAIIGLCVPISAQAADQAPRELFGRSIVVSWNEFRQQRDVGSTEFREVDSNAVFDVYISSMGRLFRRFDQHYPGSSDPLFRGDQIVGDTIGGGSRTTADFEAGAVVFAAPFRSNGVRRIEVRLSRDLSQCTAHVRFEKENSGGYTMQFNSHRNVEQEVSSVSMSGERCQIRRGNDF